MNNIIPFDFKDFEIRTISDEDGNFWFVATDVCAALGYSNTTKAINDHTDDDERSHVSLGRQGKANIINESGMYSLILRSKKAEAKQFRRWLTHEVIPSIRKNGTYGKQKNDTIDKDMLLVAINCLNLDEVGNITMVKRFGEHRGADMAFLPDYSKSAGIHHSMSELLKRHDAGISAIKANKVLLDVGILETKTRPSSSGRQKQFKSITETGQKYGCNMVSPSNPSETQAHWYDDQFEKLLEIIYAKLSINREISH